MEEEKFWELIESFRPNGELDDISDIAEKFRELGETQTAKFETEFD